MARRSRMSILKRQRELRKAEKAARKRARRHGLRIEGSAEPRPTIEVAELLGLRPRSDEQEEADGNGAEDEDTEKDDSD